MSNEKLSNVYIFGRTSKSPIGKGVRQISLFLKKGTYSAVYIIENQIFKFNFFTNNQIKRLRKSEITFVWGLPSPESN